MRRMGIFLTGVAWLLFGLAAGTAACTSFAVYSNRTVYGANLDWPGQPELRFRLEQGRAGAPVLFMDFAAPPGFVWMSGLNSEGLFVTLQEVPPRQYVGFSPASAVSLDGVLFEALLSASTTGEVEAMIGGRRLLSPPGFALHSLVADRRGQTLILEPGAGAPAVIRNTANYAVMTNFYLSDFPGADPASVEGPGADRYRAAVDELSRVMGALDLETGLGVLVRSSQDMTQASLLVFPGERMVYLALRRDWSRLYCIDLERRTVSTFRGFRKARKASLTAAGLLASELRRWE
ncbi:MAG: hypothetical protein ACM3UP_02535 [Methanocella sp.]